MNAVITITAKNQVTIPSAIMSLLGLGKGNKLWTKVKENSIVLERIPTWDELQGSVKDTYLTKGKSTLEIIEMAKTLEAKRLAKKYGL